MSLPAIATREEWLRARKELLANEKEQTRQRDALNTERRNLPMVEVDKDYTFEGPDGTVHLLDLFEGRRQLIVYHFMYGPDWEAGCPSCTAGTDEISRGFLDHLHIRDTTYAMVSRAPYAKLAAWAADHGWTIPWYSSYGTDFNIDFGVTIDAEHGGDSYNYRSKDEFDAIDPGFFGSEQPFEMPGRSCFLAVDGRVYHTYSQYARGARGHGRVVLLPRPDGARTSGGVGGAEGPLRVRPDGEPRLLLLAAAPPRTDGCQHDRTVLLAPIGGVAGDAATITRRRPSPPGTPGADGAGRRASARGRRRTRGRCRRG